jgi:hypothetical protein
MRIPRFLFLERSPKAVSIRSPMPERPLMVAGSPPIARQSSINSRELRVTYAAMVFMPSPEPDWVWANKQPRRRTGEKLAGKAFS